MYYSFLNYIVVLLLILFGCKVESQNVILKPELENRVEKVEIIKLFSPEIINKVSFLNTTSSYYNVELMSNWFNNFSSSINMEMEDEPYYETVVDILKNFMYFNLNLNYNIGKIGLSLSINNIFSFDDSEFSIEPELFINNEVMEGFYLFQDQNFSIQTAIVYTF
ncbi:MAG: hypothetical protein WA839_03985 [Flavobacteriaceae bacterium]